METELAGIVRETLAAHAAAVREVRMFGGIGFLVNGNLLAGASPRGLLLRVGPERESEALGRPGARPMVMRGRTFEGYVYVDAPALTREAVPGWIELALPHVLALPPKAAKRRRRKPAARRRPKSPKKKPARKRAAHRGPARRRARPK